MDQGGATPALEGIAAELSARCLAGMVRAGELLAGEEPERVCATFGLWLSEARRAWPWLPGLCYDALAPLGVAFPTEDRRAVVVGRLLVAAEKDAGAVTAALRSLGSAERPRWEAPAGDAAGALRVRRLAAAVDGFWSELARAASELHEVVVLRDRAGADRILGRARRRLEDVAEEIKWLAQAVADAALQPPVSEPPPPPPPAQPEEPAPHVAAATAPIPAPTAPIPPPPAVPPPSAIPPPSPVPPPRAPAAAPRPRPAQPRPPVRRPVGPPEPAPRERTWEPILFVILALIAAILVLVRVGSL